MGLGGMKRASLNQTQNPLARNHVWVRSTLGTINPQPWVDEECPATLLRPTIVSKSAQNALGDVYLIEGTRLSRAP